MAARIRQALLFVIEFALSNVYWFSNVQTFTGSILVSINPYALLPIYDLKIVKQYIGKRLGSMPPHIFAIADDAYSKMAESSKNQSLIISGESGAGKVSKKKRQWTFWN